MKRIVMILTVFGSVQCFGDIRSLEEQLQDISVHFAYLSCDYGQEVKKWYIKAKKDSYYKNTTLKQYVEQYCSGDVFAETDEFDTAYNYFYEYFKNRYNTRQSLK